MDRAFLTLPYLHPLALKNRDFSRHLLPFYINDDNNDVGDEVVDSKNPVVEGRSSPDDEKSIEMTSITIENPMNSNSVVTLDTDDVSAKQIG